MIAALAEIIAAGTVFTCTPVAVWDGDGPIWCAEGPKVRLAGIAAREIDGSCRAYHPCANGDAVKSRDALVELIGSARGINATGHVMVRGPRLRCLSDGPAKGSRTAAWCSNELSGDLSCAMVRGGHARAWGSYWRGHSCSSRASTRSASGRGAGIRLAPVRE